MPAVTPEQFESDFEAAFTAYWAGRTPIAFENSPFNSTTAFARVGDVLPADSNADAWVELALAFVDQAPVNGSINGAGTFRRNMLALVSVFVREGTGRARSSELLDALLAFFERASAIPNAVVQNITPTTVGTNGIWFQRSVSADLFYFTDRPA